MMIMGTARLLGGGGVVPPTGWLNGASSAPQSRFVASLVTLAGRRKSVPHDPRAQARTPCPYDGQSAEPARRMPGGMRRMSGWDLMEMINGGVASAGATVFTNPLDVLKTRLQVQGELQSTRGGQYGRTPLSALRTVVRQDGWRALQHGLGAAVAYNAVINGIRLGFFAYCDNQGWLSGADGRSHLPCTLGCAGLGGAMGAWAANPFYLLKIHLQSQSSTGEGHRAHYRGLSHGFRSIYAQWGVAGLYQGTQALVIRNVSLSMAQLASFAAIKDAIEDWGVWPRQSLWVSFGGGVLSGFVVIGVGTPFDVTSVRLSNQPVDARGRGRLYQSYTDCFVKIFRHEGLRGLYKGAIPAYFRKGPQNLIQLFLWDYLRLATRPFFGPTEP